MTERSRVQLPLLAQERQQPVNAEQVANDIIEQAAEIVRIAVDERGHANPPFSASQYARLLGIQVVGGDLGETSAVLLRLRDGYRIVVNQSHDVARQNFSCAHELGHVLLNRMEVAAIESTAFRRFNRSRAYDPHGDSAARQRVIERLCNVAATELLMPQMAVRGYLRARTVSIDVVSQLAREFRVSVRSATWRVSEISEVPCISAFWKQAPKTKSLRLDWCVGPGIQLPTSSHYTPVHRVVAPPSSLHAALDGQGSTSSYRQFKRGADVSRLLTQAKGFGQGQARFVASLSFVNRQLAAGQE